MVERRRGRLDLVQGQLRRVLEDLAYAGSHGAVLEEDLVVRQG